VKSFEAEALILAGTSTVWEILTDTGNYPVWDSGIIDVRGELHSGGRIRVRTNDGGKRTFRVRVRLVPGRQMTWIMRLPLGLAKIVRTFTLDDYTGITHLTVRDNATGPLRRLLRKNGTETDRALSAFVEAVRFRSELLGYHLDNGVFTSPASTAR
jgi:Polyketide cyclase / dehydrase and lipid transport